MKRRMCKRSVSIMLIFLLLLLSACGGKEGIRYNSSHSEKMYPVITTTEPKPGDHLYAVTIVLSTVDWKSLAGYTSLEAPLYLYREGLNYYAIIDKKAYCLNPEIGSDINATDDFLHFQNTTIEDISV